jgi:hypothetical protein
MYELFIKDIENNYIYVITDKLAENEIYNYKKMIKILTKRDKKKLKIIISFHC